jgi:biopolymer transport protein ExbD
MRLPDTSGQRAPFRFNITPMIDVVFLLIIFFLVASYFVRSEHSREVALPDAQRGNPDDPTSEYRLTITVERDGKLSIAGNLVSEETVNATNPGTAGIGDRGSFKWPENSSPGSSHSLRPRCTVCRDSQAG